MKLVEQVSCKITAPPKKQRKEPGYYELDKRRPGLQEAIKRVNGSGVAEWFKSDFCVYHIVPEYPRTDLTPQQHADKGLLKIRVAEYGAMFFFAVSA